MRNRSLTARGLLLVLTMGLLLAACGKKGAPEPPGPPDKVTYPRTYPSR